MTKREYISGDVVQHPKYKRGIVAKHSEGLFVYFPLSHDSKMLSAIEAELSLLFTADQPPVQEGWRNGGVYQDAQNEVFEMSVDRSGIWYRHWANGKREILSLGIFPTPEYVYICQLSDVPLLAARAALLDRVIYLLHNWDTPESYVEWNAARKQLIADADALKDGKG